MARPIKANTSTWTGDTIFMDTRSTTPNLHRYAKRAAWTMDQASPKAPQSMSTTA